MSEPQGQIISQIVTDSLAYELGIQPGDRLLSIDGQPVLDIFDYQVRQLNENLILLFRKADGDLIEFDLEKDEDEDLGLIFDNPLLTDCTKCHNRCVFCFIDQLPSGMRKSLYFKDDDMRMSFLHGNYVTLTNISDLELERLISYRFSPMNISVHATDPLIRQKMMNNRHAGKLMERLKKLSSAGIKLNCQIVLCPELNDGIVLEKSLQDLASLGDSVLSIAMVPVGITRYREENKLYPMRPFSKQEAFAVIETVRQWQQKMLSDTGSRKIYAGDEFYLKAGIPFPPNSEYEEYPQLENGVGMAALFIDTLEAYLSEPGRQLPENKYRMALPAEKECNKPGFSKIRKNERMAVIATGTAASSIIDPFVNRLADYTGIDVKLKTIINDFFGDTVTVAGLITGQDLINQLKSFVEEQAKPDYDIVTIIPDCMLKADEDIFLDDISLETLANELGCCVIAVPEQAEGLLYGLSEMAL